MTRHDASANAARRGFTLVELLIAITMLAVVGGAITMMLNSQQRFVRGASDVGAMRSQLQTASLVLPADLRMISAPGGDIIAMSDSSLRVRTTIVASVVCAVASNVVTLAPNSLLNSPGSGGGVKLTSVLLPPMAGDKMFAWDGDTQLWGNGSATTPYDVSSVGAGSCASLQGQSFVSASPAIQLTLGATPPSGVVPGSPVRVVREVQYGLYRSPSDNQWYLGYRDHSDTAFTKYEYVAGPFLPYASGGASQSGFRFTYFDTAGVEITNYAQRTRVARIVANARALTPAPVSLSGTGTPQQQKDSLRFAVSIRNRN